MPEEKIDFSKVTPEQKQKWAKGIFESGREQNFFGPPPKPLGEFIFSINELELTVEVVEAEGAPMVSSVLLPDGPEWNTEGVYLQFGDRVQSLDDVLEQEAKRRFAASIPNVSR